MCEKWTNLIKETTGSTGVAVMAADEGAADGQQGSEVTRLLLRPV